jgi:PAS domain S-box-containing protein
MPLVSSGRTLSGLSELVEFIADGVVILDADLRCLHANRAARELLGDPADELTGQDFALRFPLHERQSIVDHLSPSDTGEPGSWSSVLRSPDGDERAIECTPQFSIVDGQRVVAITVRDQTERRQLRRKTAALTKIAASMAYAGTLEATLNALARSVVQATGIVACNVLLLDISDRLRPGGTHGFAEEYVTTLHALWSAGVEPLSLQAVQERRTVVMHNVPRALLADPAYGPVHDYLRAATWETMVCVPLVYHGRSLGLLAAYYPRDGIPGDTEISFLGAIADQAAVAVKSAQLAAEAQTKAAEAERRQAEERYRTIFEAAAIGTAITDLEGRLLETNRALQELLGWSGEELRGMSFPQFTHQDDVPRQLPMFAELVAGRREYYQIEKRYIRKDGGEVWGRLTESLGRDKDGEPAFTIAMVEDITERVQAYELLEQRVAERTRELSTLLDVSHNVTSTLELRPLLALILDQLKVVADYAGSSILIVEGDDAVIVETRGPGPEEHVLQRRFPLSLGSLIWDVIRCRQPVIVGDVRGDEPLAAAYREIVGDLLETTFAYICSWLAVPLMLKDRVIGILALSHHRAAYFTAHHASLAQAIANQAAVAIENARLYERAQEVAALEERQRLARELHDSVSQALYGIALGARTARTLLDREPTQLAEPLDFVLQQAEAALTEMRALIFELRPEALETEGLVAALEKQVAAVRARHGIDVSADLGTEPEAAFEAKEAVYRIAQEALHNTVKHARARNVELRLEWNDRGIILEIADDGTGFDTAASYPGHLGLRTMHERATRVGGTLHIDSTPGRGTEIKVEVPTG